MSSCIRRTFAVVRIALESVQKLAILSILGVIINLFVDVIVYEAIDD